MGLLDIGSGYPITSRRFGMFHSGSLLFFFLLHPTLPHLLLCILLHGWEDTECCFSRILDLTCTGFEWQNWVRGSAEKGSVLLLLSVWL